MKEVGNNYSMMGVGALFLVGILATYWFKPPPVVVEQPKKCVDAPTV